MKKIAVVFHSGQGNTAPFSRHMLIGAQSVSGTELSLLHAENSLQPQQHQAVPYGQTEEVL